MDSSGEKRNVVIVSVDSLRADYCSVDVDTPKTVLDRLAASGLVFENAVAPGPSTYESMPAIFTGLDPPTGNRRGGIDRQRQISRHLRSHHPLPERLEEMGYSTVGITPNPFTSRHFGFDTGFNQFDDFLEARTLRSHFRARIVNRWMKGQFVGGLRFMSNMLGLGDVSVSAEEIVDRACRVVGEREPFLLWIMLLDPHWPYSPPKEHRNGTNIFSRYRANWRAGNLSNSVPSSRDVEVMKRLYTGTIQAVDDSLGVLRDKLDQYDPVYIFHADHGEAFGEHDAFGHGEQLFEENIHVPLIVGNVGSEGKEISRPVSLRRLPEMATHLARGNTNLVKFTDDWVYSRSERGDLCVRGQNWKYYKKPGEDGELFDLGEDPDERGGEPVNLDRILRSYAGHLDEANRLAKLMEDGSIFKRV